MCGFVVVVFVVVVGCCLSFGVALIGLTAALRLWVIGRGWCMDFQWGHLVW